MEIFINVLSVVFIVYGLVLFFGGGMPRMLAGVICIGSALYGADTMSLLPFVLGFAGLWILRIVGLER